MVTGLEGKTETAGASGIARALAAGIAGTATVTVLNEVGRSKA